MAGAISFRQQTPWRRQLLPAAPRLRFARATTIGMIHRIAGDSAVDRADAPMARTSRFAQHYIFVLCVANLADRRIAILINLANFARRQSNLRIPLVARHKSSRPSGTTDHLRAAARSQLDVMYRQSHRNRTQRETIANFGWRGRPAHQFGSDLQSIRGNDIDL